MIKIVAPYVKIIRPVNALMTGCAVLLGMWITTDLPYEIPIIALPTFLPTIAAIAAMAYGNVINDIFDVKSDRVNHPDRPLVNGKMTVRTAAILAVALAILSIVCAAATSLLHLLAAIVPIIMLTLYSIYFKRTRVAGNIIVAALTAYAILYGGLPRQETKILFLPAALAFLLNFCRELVKDVQDAKGDALEGWRTSADLPTGVIRGLLVGAATVYTILLPLPVAIFGHFGGIYILICAIAVIPLHIYWVILVLKSGQNVGRYAGKIKSILKLEMLAGLIALAFDHTIQCFIQKILFHSAPLYYFIVDIM